LTDEVKLAGSFQTNLTYHNPFKYPNRGVKASTPGMTKPKHDRPPASAGEPSDLSKIGSESLYQKVLRAKVSKKMGSQTTSPSMQLKK